MPDTSEKGGGRFQRPLGRTTNKNQRRSSPFFSALAKEDVEYDDIELADVPSYVNVSFENHVTLALSGEGNTEKYFERSNPETDRKGVRIVWVEHAKTGELVPVAVRDGGAFAEDSSQVPEEVSDNGDDANSPLLMPPSLSGKQLNGETEGGRDLSIEQSNIAYADGVTLIRFIFFFVQGLLAGFCFTTISTQSSSRADADFIVSYQSNAMEYRRLFYLLCSISLVGSIDTLLSLMSTTVDGGERDNQRGVLSALCRAITTQKGSTLLVALVIAMLHGIAFLSTIIMTKVDTLIAIRGGASQSVPGPVWATALLSSSTFASDLGDWRTLDLVRFVCSVLGWAGACYLCYKSVTAVEARSGESNRLKRALHEWRKRVNVLEGNEGLELLDHTALRRLMALQEVGLDRVRTALQVAAMKNAQP